MTHDHEAHKHLNKSLRQSVTSAAYQMQDMYKTAGIPFKDFLADLVQAHMEYLALLLAKYSWAPSKDMAEMFKTMLDKERQRIAEREQ